MAKKKKRKKKRVAVRLDTATDAELEAEMRRRDRDRNALLRKWQRAVMAKAKVEAEMVRVGMPIPKQPRNVSGMSLVEALRKGMGRRHCTITDAASAALDAGYLTTNQAFVSTVGVTLADNKDDFKRVEPGVYEVKR